MTNISSSENIDTSQHVSYEMKIVSPPTGSNLTSLTSQTTIDIVDIDNQMAKRDSIHKQKSLPSSLKTPRSSSVTKFYNKAFKIHTCCGILELNCLKLTSMIALSISTVAFCLLLAAISVNYSIVTNLYNNVQVLQTDASYYRDLMKLSCRVSAVSEYNRTLSLQYTDLFMTYHDKYYEVLNVLLVSVPDNIVYSKRHNISREDVRSRKAVKVELSVVDMVRASNYTQAINTLDSSLYQYYLAGYPEEVQPVLDYVINMQNMIGDEDLATTLLSLIILVVSMVIVIPVLVAYIALSVRKDTTKEKQLRQVKKYMLMDTINDPALSEKFKEFCKIERSEENFLLLEKISDYKKLCERSFEIQVFLYDTDILSGSDQFSETTTSSNEDASKKKKGKKGFTEKDLYDIEKKKFEIAFEIHTDFLDVRGERSVNTSKQIADNVKQSLDYFAKGENESLPENLFEIVECEMCVLMMDTHHRFKVVYEQQLKEKRKILTTIKRKIDNRK